MNSELPARLPGVTAAVARGADLINALLRPRFLAGTAAAPLELAELTFESGRGRLPGVFFGALALGGRATPLELMAGTDEDAESEWLLPLELRMCSGDTGAEGVDEVASSRDASTVAFKLGKIMAAVPTR